MKKVILFSFFFFRFCIAVPLIYVHIGDDVPSYFIDAAKQARFFNASIEMYLIANQRALVKKTNILEQYHIQPIAIEHLPRSNAHNNFLQYSKLSQGFWRSASERFLLLDDFMQANNIEEIYHCENDVMLYMDLQENLPIFRKNYQGVAAVFDSDFRCIPSFLYIGSKNAMNQLAHYFAQKASSGRNDMEIIADFKKEVDEKIIDRLPLIMDTYITKYGLKNALGHAPIKPLEYSKNFHEFNSVFDGAALGQYIGGTIATHLGPGFINETCIFNPSFCTFEWSLDSKNRKIPYLVFDGIKYKINNLHIHSKQLHKFLSL